jgi:hypothetical protein
VPSAIVYHEIHEYRVRKEFFLAWWFEFGRGSVRAAGGLGAWQLFKIFGRACLIGVRWVFTLNSQKRFYRKCRIYYAAGKIVEVFHHTKNISSPAHNLERQAGKEHNI